MTKIDKASIFTGEDVKEAKLPDIKTRDERLAAWRRENEAAYRAAVSSHVCCSPTRAELLLVSLYEGNGPSDL